MVELNNNNPETSVTVVISRRVKSGCEAQFETFLLGVTTACSQFPGYLGSSIFRPATCDDPEYRVIFKFDRLSHLRHWETSEERLKWFTQAEALTECPPNIQVLTGLETWFTLPGKAAIVPPPRYKMALVTWVAVFPLITAISTVLHTPLLALPPILRSMVVTAIAVPTMTYLLMPLMTQLCAAWLYPSPLAPPAHAEDPAATLALEPSPALPMAQPCFGGPALPIELEVEPALPAQYLGEQLSVQSPGASPQ